MNAEPTPYDKVAHAVVREPIGKVLPELVAAVEALPGRALPGPYQPGLVGENHRLHPVA